MRTRLFEQAVGLERPWYVEWTEFDAGARRLDIHLNFEAGGTFACGACGDGGCKAYDTAVKQWRHTPHMELDHLVYHSDRQR